MAKTNYVEKYSKKTQKFRMGGMMGMNYPSRKGPMMDEQMMAKGGMMEGQGMGSMNAPMYKAGMMQGGGMMMDKKQMMYQDGGEMAPEAGGDPMADVMAAVEQVYQSQDPQMALQVVNALYEMQMGGGEAAPAEGGAAPGPETGAPMARKGIKTSPVFKASIKG